MRNVDGLKWNVGCGMWRVLTGTWGAECVGRTELDASSPCTPLTAWRCQHNVRGSFVRQSVRPLGLFNPCPANEFVLSLLVKRERELKLEPENFIFQGL